MTVLSIYNHLYLISLIIYNFLFYLIRSNHIIIYITLINTVHERSATNCLNKKVTEALRNESREIIEVRLGGRKFHKKGPK